MQELQDLGEELAALSADRLKKIDIPENLREALQEAQRMNSHGAKRRQLQYVGKVMRDVDAEPIRAALAAIRGESAVQVARMHRIERLRTRLLEDEKPLAGDGRHRAELAVGGLERTRALDALGGVEVRVRGGRQGGRGEQAGDQGQDGATWSHRRDPRL